MNMSLPPTWTEAPLSQLGRVIGGGTPSRSQPAYYEGTIPWLTVKDLREDHFEVFDAQEHITQDAVTHSATHLLEPRCVIVATRVGLGRVAVNGVPLAINQDLKAIVCKPTVLPQYLCFALHKAVFEILKFSQGTTVRGIRQDDLLRLHVPLPPLPVQERIVAILQKADEIRRKRQEALNIADQILPALFIEMFGDPATNPKGWPVRKLADVAEFLDSKRRPISERCRQQRIKGKKPEELYPYYGANGQVGWIDGYLFDEDLVLLTEDGGAFGSTTEPIAYCISGKTWVNNHAHVLRPLPGLTTVDYLYRAIAVRPDILPLISGTTRSKLNMSCAKAIPVPLPPFELQQRFGEYTSAFEIVRAKLQASLRDAESTFNVLLQQAFTGELTAEWEVRNADWIVERQAFYQRLPQLVLLAFLHEKAQQARKAGVLITALMKYAFLLQMEGASRRRLYSFVPYHYGPFAQEVYSDLENLQQQGW